MNRTFTLCFSLYPIALPFGYVLIYTFYHYAVPDANSNLQKRLLASYGGLFLYKDSSGQVLYSSNFNMATSMSANVANLVNNTTWSCPGIESALILPVRVMEASNNVHICMGFWIVFANGLYFVPLVATSSPTKIIGSNYIN